MNRTDGWSPMRWLMCWFAALLIVHAISNIAFVQGEESESSSIKRVREEAHPKGETWLRLEAVRVSRDGVESPAPTRVILRDSTGEFVDCSGRDFYADGRSFFDGACEVAIAPGKAKLQVNTGPNYLPLQDEVEVNAGKINVFQCRLQEWFSPEKLGWFAGDNHVHAQHDAKAQIKTSLDYAVLQARANGLTFVTEAGSPLDYANLADLNRDDFQIRFVEEMRPGPFIGHLNAPGLKGPIPQERFERIIREPWPVQSIAKIVDSEGGALIHTHPLTPRQQLHWMSATEHYSDIVCQRTAHAFDTESRMTDLMWWAGLNLGNRQAVSSYTDCALGRKNTPSPGDRRIYVESKSADFEAYVAGIRQGKTVATNGGPIFCRWTLGGVGTGGILSDADRQRGKTECRIQVDSLNPIGQVEVYYRGKRVQSFPTQGAQGKVDFAALLDVPAEPNGWFVLRVQDQASNWAITSPIYVQESRSATRGNIAAVFQISNATRFIELRKEFFAHSIVTVSEEDQIKLVELRKDGVAIRTWRASEGNGLPKNGKLPVTEIRGEYKNGWIWHPSPEEPQHIQVDWKIEESGWYQLHAETESGAQISSDSLHWESENPLSHQLSSAVVLGPDTYFSIRGYSEEMPLTMIHVPFEGDHWWFPENVYFDLTSKLSGQEYHLESGPNKEAANRFRVEKR